MILDGFPPFYIMRTIFGGFEKEHVCPKVVVCCARTTECSRTIGVGMWGKDLAGV
jgi:hypothetical protein